MRVDGNHGATLGYEPNSFGEWQEQPEYKEPPLDLFGAADSWNFREDDSDYYTQPGNLFRLMSPAQQQVLFENTAAGGASTPRPPYETARKPILHTEGVARASISH
jgi:catalase